MAIAQVCENNARLTKVSQDGANLGARITRRGSNMYVKSIDQVRIVPEAYDDPPHNPIMALVIAAALALALWVAIGAAFYTLLL